MSQISGSWSTAETLVLRMRVVAWAVVRVRDNKIISVWDNEPEAQVLASTGLAGEYRHVLLTGEYKR